MINQKQNDNKISGTVIAEVAGAAVIAGAAVAATMALRDEKTRDKIKEVAGNIKDQAVGYMKHMQDQAKDKKDEVEGKLAEGKAKVNKTVDSAKNFLDQEAKDVKKATVTL